MANQDALQSHILQLLDQHGSIEDTQRQLLDSQGMPFDNQLVMGVLNRLASHSMVAYTIHEHEQWTLTAEGLSIAKTGSHEVKVFEAVPAGAEGITLAELQIKMGSDSVALKVGQGQAFKNKWIAKKGDRLVRLANSVGDKTREDLLLIQSGKWSEMNEDVLKELKKRKLCDKSKSSAYTVKKGPSFSLTLQKQATDVTSEMIQSGSWKSVAFKQYNFKADGIPPKSGHLHPLMKVREEFRQIFFEMGFHEMPTNRYVESSFWNFDALFQPQDHPARDMHDTFFLKSPATTDTFPEDYLARVSDVHSKGGYGSTGYKCPWQRSEAQKLVLRTHTTAVSSWMLYKLAQEPTFRPIKYFSIDRVFRNETVDATHLAEFHQVEGLIADYDLTLGDLIGFLDVFFKKLGVSDLRFKPTYNPYTEPSLEVFSFHKGLNKWVEVGNSGMFRPEMLRPMGLPENVRVIAWGLSLERPTMIKFGINNIRELLGHKVDLDLVENSPFYRLKPVLEEEMAGKVKGIEIK